jgi:hypothetical protein
LEFLLAQALPLPTSIKMAGIVGAINGRKIPIGNTILGVGCYGLAKLIGSTYFSHIPFADVALGLFGYAICLQGNALNPLGAALVNSPTTFIASLAGKMYSSVLDEKDKVEKKKDSPNALLKLQQENSLDLQDQLKFAKRAKKYARESAKTVEELYQEAKATYREACTSREGVSFNAATTFLALQQFRSKAQLDLEQARLGTKKLDRMLPKETDQNKTPSLKGQLLTIGAGALLGASLLFESDTALFNAAIKAAAAFGYQLLFTRPMSLVKGVVGFAGKQISNKLPRSPFDGKNLLILSALVGLIAASSFNEITNISNAYNLFLSGQPLPLEIS